MKKPVGRPNNPKMDYQRVKYDLANDMRQRWCSRGQSFSDMLADINEILKLVYVGIDEDKRMSAKEILERIRKEMGVNV